MSNYCMRCGIPHGETPCKRDETDQPVGEYPDLPTGFTIKAKVNGFVERLLTIIDRNAAK